MKLVWHFPLFAFLIAHVRAQDTPEAIPEARVSGWASQLSQSLQQLVKDTTKYDKIIAKYRSKGITPTKVSGNDILDDAEKELSYLMKSKISSLEKLYKRAELSYENSLRDGYEPGDNEKPYFYDSKGEIDNNTTPLVVEPKFHPSKEVYMNASFVHVPTDVYKYGKEILKTINWSKGLDEAFRNNSLDNPRLLWQYFGASNGVYRNFPGIAWPDPDTDLYDCRQRGWYILGSSSRKDVVILLDLSGSMIGSNLVIAKLGALLLLKETLLENDFVAIVTFSGEAFVLGSFDDLVQATDDNKDILRAKIPSLEAKDVAKVTAGFEKAFELLRKARNSSNTGSNCNQVINFFTDGVETGRYEDLLPVLEKYNADKKVRIFTYLIGRDTSTRENVQNIACKNRGYFSQVETIGDVREHILKYLDVLSRPLAKARDHTAKWTPIYSDSLGTGMMTSLVMPVFSPDTENPQLLGVVGTDIPLVQLQRTATPAFGLGVNGYSFAINNNGFLYFHPKIKLQVGYLPVPPTIYLTEVENAGDSTAALLNDCIMIINTTTATQQMQMRVVSVSDDFKRTVERDVTYYYKPVSDQSFSVAIAIPESGQYSYDLRGSLNEGDLANILKNTDGIVIANWPYCDERSKKVVSPEFDPVYMFAKELVDPLNRNAAANCNKKMLGNLYLDAKIIRDSAADITNPWKNTVNNDDEIQSIFFGTHGGMQYIVQKPPVKVEDVDRDLFKKDYYQRAADYIKSADGTVIYSAPYRGEAWPSSEEERNASTYITATVPIVLNSQVLAAAVGTNISSSKIQSIFKDKTKQCDQSDCRSCDNSESVSCYLVDTDGYIIASNQNDTDVGKFFGVLDGFVMEDLLNSTIFTGFDYKDTQAECDANAGDNGDNSNAMRLISPLLSIPAYITWLSQTVIMTLAQFNLYSWFTSSNQAAAVVDENGQTCVKQYTFYNYNESSTTGTSVFSKQIDLNEAGSAFLCQSQLKYYVSRLDKSNLMLIVIDVDRQKNEDCDPLKTIISVNAKTVVVNANFSQTQTRKDPVYKCYSSTEPQGPCSGGPVIKFSLLLVMLISCLQWMQ